MSRRLSSAVALGIIVAVAAPAAAHVTIQPNEGVTGAFSRFVVRVPNERPDASTVRVDVEFPSLAFVSFEPKDGWRRNVQEGEFAEPVEAFGDEVAEGVLSVSWRGGEIGPGEFDEFGFSARMPDGEEELEFRAFQHYSSGEVVEWTGPADSDEPASHVAVYDIGAGEGEGQLAVLARVNDAQGQTDHASHLAALQEEDSNVPLLLGVAALVVALIALFLALRRPRSPSDA